jgi:signal peptidase II
MASKKKTSELFTPRSRRAIVICAVATLALVVIDLASKDWAAAELSVPLSYDPGPVCEPDEDGHQRMQRGRAEPIVIIDEHLELRYAENCGAAFGSFRSAGPVVRKLVFGAAAIAASVALFWMFAQGKGGPFFAWAVPMIVSGALGNFVDRLRYGYVIDFIRAYNLNIPYFDEWPTFNVADIGITVGVICLVIDSFRKPQPAIKAKRVGVAAFFGGKQEEDDEKEAPREEAALAKAAVGKDGPRRVKAAKKKKKKREPEEGAVREPSDPERAPESG